MLIVRQVTLQVLEQGQIFVSHYRLPTVRPTRILARFSLIRSAPSGQMCWTAFRTQYSGAFAPGRWTLEKSYVIRENAVTDGSSASKCLRENRSYVSFRAGGMTRMQSYDAALSVLHISSTSPIR
uniref:Uncharacterized protein n=1 Tax=Anopheles merus TaxID=30066 RepID=A0A182V3I6_ANOME